MTQFFLDTLVGDGDSENPFRPAHADGGGSIINLRPAPFCLVGAEALIGTPTLGFGDTLDQRLTGNRKRALANALGLSLDQTDFRGIIAELLLLHGREDGTRWRPLKQDVNGRHRISLGGQSVYDAPVIVGATFTDNFNRSNETLETSANWANVLGAMSVTSNELAVDTNKSIYRCESAMATDDHYVECVVATHDQIPGINARMSEGDSSNWDAYHFRSRPSGTTFEIYEITNNSFTQIASDNTTVPAEPFTLRITVDGSTITGDLNAADLFGDVTDTVLTGQVKTGFRDFNSAVNQRWDDYEAADLAAAPAVYPPFPRRQNRRGRM